MIQNKNPGYERENACEPPESVILHRDVYGPGVTITIAIMMCAKEETSTVFPGRKLNFLLVDDDDICLFIHRRVLDLCGYCASAHSAGNGKSALAALDNAANGAFPFPDVILLDLEMPMMNGIGFLEAYRTLPYEHKDRIAIVLLSSSVSEKDKAYARSLGASHCLSKPLTQENLDSVVRQLYKDEGPLPLMYMCR